MLTWRAPAASLHNTIRAFEGWPGTRAVFRVADSAEPITLKIITARLEAPDASDDAQAAADKRVVRLVNGALRVICDDGSVLGVTAVQPPGGRAMAAAAYAAGLRGRALTREEPPQ